MQHACLQWMERDICNYHRSGSRNFCSGGSDLRTKLMTPIISRFCLFKSWERSWLQIWSVTYTHAQRRDTNGTHHILLVTTSSPVRFSLAFKVGREKARPTSKTREKRPGDEVVLVKDRALKLLCLVFSDKIALSRLIQIQIKSHS